jgi:hypothetical protein
MGSGEVDARGLGWSWFSLRPGIPEILCGLEGYSTVVELQL